MEQRELNEKPKDLAPLQEQLQKQEATWTTHVLSTPDRSAPSENRNLEKNDAQTIPSQFPNADQILSSFDKPGSQTKNDAIMPWYQDGSQTSPIFTGLKEVEKSPNKEKLADNAPAGKDNQEEDGSDKNADNHSMLSAVNRRLGQSLEVANRRLGCAVAVSQVLNEVDPSLSVTNNNRALAKDLEAHGYKAVPQSELKPGDVIIGKRPDGMPGHTAIYMGDGKVFNNNSDSGKMQIDDLAKFSQGMHDANGRWNKNGFSEVIIYRKPDSSQTASRQDDARPNPDLHKNNGPSVDHNSPQNDESKTAPAKPRQLVFTPLAGLDQIDRNALPSPIADLPPISPTNMLEVRFQPGIDLTAPISATKPENQQEGVKPQADLSVTFQPSAGLSQLKSNQPSFELPALAPENEIPVTFEAGIGLVEPVSVEDKGGVRKQTGGTPTAARVESAPSKPEAVNAQAQPKEDSAPFELVGASPSDTTYSPPAKAEPTGRVAPEINFQLYGP